MLPKRTSESLKGPEDRFKNIFDNIDDVVIICDPDCRILEVNNRACERLGYSWNELLLMPVWKLETPEYRSLFEEQRNMVKESERAVFEVNAFCRDGTVIPYEISTRVIDYMGAPAILSIGRDISEKKAVFETLKKSEEKFRSIFDNSNDAIIIYDLQGRIIEVNKICCERTGYTYDELLRMSVESLKGLGVQSNISEEIEKLKKYGYAVIEIECLCKDGSIFPFEISNRVVNYDGRPAILSIGRDITEQKRARQELEKSEERYRIAAEQTGQIIFDYDPTNNSFELSGAIEELTGYSPEEFCTSSIDIRKQIHPDDVKKFLQEYETGPKSDNRYRGEYRFRRNDGSYFYAEDSGIILRDAAGQPRRVIGAIKDITPIKVTSEKLRESEARYRSFLQNFAGIAFQIDKDFNTVFAQGRTEEITGYSKEDFFSGKLKWRDLVDPRDLEKLCTDEKFLKENPEVTLEKEYRIIRKNGETRWIRDILQCIHDDKGNVLFYQGYSYDITEKKAAEEAILHAKIESEVARSSKTDFVVNMSHELRTPLNSIIGFSDLLLLELFGNLNPKQQKYVKNISVSAKHLLDLINNLLDLSKIEAGKSEVCYEEVSIPDVIAEVSEIISPKAQEKNIVLETRVAMTAKMIRADRIKLKQILYNLLSNAIKFTPAGGKVTVTATLRENNLEVSVIDTGIGIPADKTEIIFLPFVQADSSTSREFGGTGLGLTLVKEFVEIHGGKVWVNSEPGKGSTFTFLLPEKERNPPSKSSS